MKSSYTLQLAKKIVLLYKFNPNTNCYNIREGERGVFKKNGHKAEHMGEQLWTVSWSGPHRSGLQGSKFFNWKFDNQGLTVVKQVFVSSAHIKTFFSHPDK